ncbi:hypothetical protein [Mariluticola halotolerans]|uniref:hypothetical protein n=1 Tax=Mariluticola halotolerans TaxID=2909283 RepID=UPI0026E4075A|nr:hypothetical protein [Mariluticola halotolerans]UJQ94459.1 hypothetical protein L1P08_00245 [Mariluticola halotolerans]
MRTKPEADPDQDAKTFRALKPRLAALSAALAKTGRALALHPAPRSTLIMLAKLLAEIRRLLPLRVRNVLPRLPRAGTPTYAELALIAAEAEAVLAVWATANGHGDTPSSAEARRRSNETHLMLAKQVENLGAEEFARRLRQTVAARQAQDM